MFLDECTVILELRFFVIFIMLVENEIFIKENPMFVGKIK